MRRLVQYLRLARFPLAFTAIGDAWTVWFLGPMPAGGTAVAQLANLAAVSAGLYGLGMMLNDAVDAPADAARDPRKPIPSGDVSRVAAAALAIGLGAIALLAAWHYTRDTLITATVVAAMIVGYDVGLKRIPILGLLLLGLIRGMQCQIAAIQTARGDVGAVLAVWVSLFLFTHVTMASWIAYEWEGKRPAIVHRWLLAFAVIGLDVLAVTFLDIVEPLGWRLLPPLACGLAYWFVLLWILASKRYPDGPAKGRMAIRLGLIWLLVYDAAFLLSAGRWAGVAAMAALLMLLLLSSRVLVALSRRMNLIGSPAAKPQVADPPWWA